MTHKYWLANGYNAINKRRNALKQNKKIIAHNETKVKMANTLLIRIIIRSTAQQ